jgi:hypothetical protein
MTYDLPDLGGPDDINPQAEVRNTRITAVNNRTDKFLAIEGDEVL